MPSANAKRVVPYLQIRTFRNGSEPYFGPGSDFGYNWYSNLQNEYKFGTVSYQTLDSVLGMPMYAPHIEYIGTERIRTPNRDNAADMPIGLVMRPFVIPKDIGSWSTLPNDLGIWETSVSYMNPPVELLRQNFQGVDGDDETVIAPWGSQSDYTHPAKPSFAFTILPAAVTPDYNPFVGGVPYSQFGWSGGKWAIRFFNHGNPILMKSFGGVMIPLMELASPARMNNGDNPDLMELWVRHQRGALMISGDHGATYDVWWEPGGTTVSCPAGKYQFTGIGMAAAVGVHQLAYGNDSNAGTYSSPKLPMERIRLGAPSLVSFRYANQTNTEIEVVNIAPTLGTNYMQYRINFTAGVVHTTHFDYYYSPEAYAVELAWPTVPSLWFPLHDGGSTFEGRIQRLTINKPFELDSATCDFTCRYRVSEGGIIGSYGLKLIQVWGGWIWDDGTNDVELMFTGYLTDPTVRQVNSEQIDVTFKAESTALRPKRMQWRDSNASPYDGLTPNQALLKWANAMGMNTTFLQFDTSGRGDNVLLPYESPEKPAYVPVVGEPRWDIMGEIAKYARLELGVANNGSYTLFPSDTFVLTPYTWNADPEPDQSFIESIDYEQSVTDTYTGVLVRGKTQWNEQIAAWIYDAEAETNIFSSRFRPWAEWHVETVEAPVTQQWLGQIALGLAWNKITPHFKMTWKGELAHFVSRRHAVWVKGTTVGAGALAKIGVISLTHNFDRSDPMMAWTEVRGRRLS